MMNHDDDDERHSSMRFIWLAIASILWYPIHQWSSTIGAFWAVATYFVVKYSYELWLLFRTLPRDASAGLKSYRAKKALNAQMKRGATVAQLFTETADRFAHKLFISSDVKSFTFAEAREYSNRVANYFREVGLLPGDEVALLMENRPEFVIIWLGLSKLGVVTALVNYNLKSASLAHCINVVNTKVVIFSSSLTASMRTALPHLNDASTIAFYHFGEKSKDDINSVASEDLVRCIETASTDEVIHRGEPKDRLLYIFTSGTTGFPKAAIVTNQRYMFCGANMFYVVGFKSSDKIYLSLPLYHNSGGTLGPGAAIIYGVSCHVAAKFSASRFWVDCIKYECTLALYIGEMIRYLLAQPERDTDHSHQVRLLYGHGARRQLWKLFTQRFGVKNLREIYGSTEGNGGFINTDNTAGSIGFRPTICRLSKVISKAILPMYVIKVDPETGKPIRNSRGFCVECKPGEAGELICLITNEPSMRFEGYVDKEATKKKVYDDIFEKGEKAFATGDVVIYDELGYVFFQDRTGDTFRWKSENVSTNEVESVMAKILSLTDAIVYGVSIEGTEGKAGMAAILNRSQCEEDLNIHLDELLDEMKNALPSYAIPLFIRFIKEVESTSTLKYKKTNLVNEGFNPNKITDPLYFHDNSKKAYVPLTKQLYEDIITGKIRL